MIDSGFRSQKVKISVNRLKRSSCSHKLIRSRQTAPGETFARSDFTPWSALNQFVVVIYDKPPPTPNSSSAALVRWFHFRRLSRWSLPVSFARGRSEPPENCGFSLQTVRRTSFGEVNKIPLPGSYDFQTASGHRITTMIAGLAPHIPKLGFSWVYPGVPRAKP